jgi:16S rRNA (cytosine967-C5)-methyltransferase
MHPKALLDAACALLREVMTFASPADAVVSAYFRQNRSLGPRERHTLAETTYAVLRRRLLWQHFAQSGSGPLERRLVALAWQGDAAFLAAALAPAEQQWLQQVSAIDRASLAPKLRHNLPDWVSRPLAERLGDDGLLALADALNEPAPLDLRVNLLRMGRDEAAAALAEAGIAARPTPWSPWGLRVEGKPAVQKLALFESGAIEVQDEGSQLLALLMEARRGEMVADFCAGAGGKTLALGAVMRSTGRLYAFDTSGHRLAALKPRVARSGLSNVHTVQIAHERDERIRRLGGKLDRVLVDAPCSGLGTLRRNPDLKWRQSPASVAELAALQARILAAAAGLVKPGGRLVYATCSLLADENESVADAFAAAHAGWRPVPAAQILARQKVDLPGLVPDAAAMRLWPHQHHTDGFYAMAWERE